MNKKELIKTLFFPEREFAHQQVLLLCKSHDLSTDFIFNGNNKDNYHTKEHCLDVAFMAFNMVQVIVNKEDRYKLSRQALLAGIFHDSYHSLGVEKDSQNIFKSIVMFNKYYNNSKNLDSDDYQAIIHAIQATEYPHKEIGDTLLSCIISDADILSSLTPGGIYHSLMGFVNENKTDLHSQKDTYIKFINSLPTLLKLDVNKDFLLKNKDKMISSVELLAKIIV